MIMRSHPVYLGIFLVVLAPIGAAVLVTALLLFGVEPSAGEKLQAPGTQLAALRGKTREALEELELPALPGTNLSE